MRWLSLVKAAPEGFTDTQVANQTSLTLHLCWVQQLLQMSSSQGKREHSLASSTNVSFDWKCHSHEPKVLTENHCLKIVWEICFLKWNNSPEVLWNSALEETRGFLFHRLLYFTWEDPNSFSKSIPWLSVLDITLTQTHQGMVKQQQQQE